MSTSELTALLHQVLSRLSKIEEKVGISSTDGGSSAGEAELPRSVRGFDQYMESNLKPFLAAAEKLGGDAQAGANIVNEGWKELRKFLLLAANCKAPDQKQMPALMKGISTQVQAANAAIKRNEWEKHSKTLSEGIGCLNWVLVKPAPRDFIESFVGGSDYWANGIRKEYRTTNPDQIAFCDTFKALIVELIAYVKEYHLAGLQWNANGVDVNDFNPDQAAAPTASTNKPAATTTAAAKPAATAAPADVKGGLFAALNQEGAVTSGLKKVTKDMQTWRAEYKGDAPPVAAKAPVTTSTRAAAANQVKGPPKMEFQTGASKWLVENQTEAQGVVEIEIKDKKETVYILNCIGATIDIKGKCKSIVVDSCKKTKVFFDVAMASVEVVNSSRMTVGCRDAVPAVAIDKTDGIVVQLPRSSLTTEIVASKSSEMNLQWHDEEGELIERPIPEQYVHRIKGTSITADISDLYSH